MRYLRRFNEKDEYWDRQMKVFRGEVEGWEDFSDEERIKYLNPDYSQLEVEFENMIFSYVRESKVNWKMFLTIKFMVTDIAKEDKVLASEIMYRITEMESPIKVVKYVLERWDVSKLTWSDMLNQINDLSSSINPFVDYIEEFN